MIQSLILAIYPPLQSEFSDMQIGMITSPSVSLLRYCKPAVGYRSINRCRGRCRLACALPAVWRCYAGGQFLFWGGAGRYWSVFHPNIFARPLAFLAGKYGLGRATMAFSVTLWQFLALPAAVIIAILWVKAIAARRLRHRWRSWCWRKSAVILA